jgi:integrase
MSTTSNMLPRRLDTPHGAVRLSSIWKRNRFYLVAAGPLAALRAMFPLDSSNFEVRHSSSGRRVFSPASQPVTDIGHVARLCDTWVSEWRKLFALPNPTPSGAPSTLKALVDRFVAVRDGQVKPATLEKYRYHFNYWYSVIPAETSPGSLTSEGIQLARKALAKRISSVTANCALSTLKCLLNFAFQEGWLTASPWKRVQNLPEADFKSGWWSPEEVDIAMRVAAEDEHQPTAVFLIVLGCMMGLRKDEMVTLRWQDLLLDQKDAATGEPKPVCHLRCDAEWRPKSGKARDLPIPPQARDVLLQHRKASGYVLESNRNAVKRGGTKRVYRYDPDRVWDRIRTKAVAAGAKYIRLHDMRHSYASILLDQGFSAEKVARWLGHSDTRMVFKVYGHLLAYDDQIQNVQFTRGSPSRAERHLRFPGIK